jgi:hypothetical protein
VKPPTTSSFGSRIFKLPIPVTTSLGDTDGHCLSEEFRIEIAPILQSPLEIGHRSGHSHDGRLEGTWDLDCGRWQGGRLLATKLRR